MIKIIGKEILGKGSIFELTRLNVELDSGKKIDWDVVLLPEREGVSIIALDNQDNIYLVEEYMAAVDKKMLSIPKGMVEIGEKQIDAAKRELKEETGTEGRLEEFRELKIWPGYTNAKNTLFIARNVVEVGRVKIEDEEHLETVKMPLKQAVEMVMQGKVEDYRTIAAILLAEKINKK